MNFLKITKKLFLEIRRKLNNLDPFDIDRIEYQKKLNLEIKKNPEKIYRLRIESTDHRSSQLPESFVLKICGKDFSKTLKKLITPSQ